MKPPMQSDPTETSSQPLSLPSPWLQPEWDAPARVRALVTTRAGGVSQPPWDSFNLGLRAGEEAVTVHANRAMLRRHLPAEPAWLHQVHGATVVDAADVAATGSEPQADASFAGQSSVVCAVLVADCMPVLLADREGTCVGVAHAGWRGMSGGVIESLLARMPVAPAQLSAWLGPAIGPSHFEVGDDVRTAFTQDDAEAVAAFVPYPGRPGKWLCNLERLARRRLAQAGVSRVFGGGMCTVSEPRFYSYRRDRTTGRMGAFIWLDA